jgi:hypothetical protein
MVHEADLHPMERIGRRMGASLPVRRSAMAYVATAILAVPVFIVGLVLMRAVLRVIW